MWNAPSVEVLRDVEFYYVHRDLERMQKALASLVELNGAANQPLIAFMIAADLAEADFDVLALGATGPNSVNCLWAHFYATGKREPILAMLAALPSWHMLEREMRAKGRDPSQSVVQGAGHSVHWSLRPHLVRHGKLRAICKQEAGALDQPLQVREELLKAFAEVARRGCEGDETAEPRPLVQREFGPPPDLQWLEKEPMHSWTQQIAEKYPSFEAIEEAIIAAEAHGHLRDAGVLCVAVRYYSLAAKHFTNLEEMPPIPILELGMAIFHEALALARAGNYKPSAFAHAIAIFESQPDQLQWVGGSLEARVQKALMSRDPQDAKDALDRIEKAATGPFGNAFGTLVKWARSALVPESPAN